MIVCRKASHDSKQHLALEGRQGGGRLIEDDHAARLREGLEDFNHLPLADAQIADRFVERYGEFAARTANEFFRLPAKPTPVEPAGHSQTGQDHVLQHREVGRQRGLLRDQAQTGAQGGARAGKLHRLAIEPDLAGIGRDMSGDHPRKRGFASSVGAAQRVDFAGFELQAGLGQRPGRTKALADPAQLQEAHALVRVQPAVPANTVSLINDSFALTLAAVTISTGICSMRCDALPDRWSTMSRPQVCPIR